MSSSFIAVAEEYSESFSLAVKGVTLEQIRERICEKTGYNLTFNGPPAKGQISLDLQRVTLEESIRHVFNKYQIRNYSMVYTPMEKELIVYHFGNDGKEISDDASAVTSSNKSSTKVAYGGEPEIFFQRVKGNLVAYREKKKDISPDDEVVSGMTYGDLEANLQQYRKVKKNLGPQSEIEPGISYGKIYRE